MYVLRFLVNIDPASKDSGIADALTSLLRFLFFPFLSLHYTPLLRACPGHTPPRTLSPPLLLFLILENDNDRCIEGFLSTCAFGKQFVSEELCINSLSRFSTCYKYFIKSNQ